MTTTVTRPQTSHLFTVPRGPAKAAAPSAPMGAASAPGSAAGSRGGIPPPPAPLPNRRPPRGGGDGGGNDPDGDDPMDPHRRSASDPPRRPPRGGDDGGGDPDDDGESSGSEDDAGVRRTMKRRKFREHDEIRIPQLPADSAGFKAWKNVVFMAVNNAANRPDDQALRWVQSVEDPLRGDQEFERVPKRFRGLSRKLATALQKAATGRLGRKISQLAEDYLNLGMSCPGLLLLRVVFRRFAASETVEAVYNITDLSVVKCKGGDLEQFQMTWTEILRAMTGAP